MAIGIDASGEMLNRASNAPTLTSFTMMAWFYIDTQPTAGNFSNILTYEGTSGNYYWMGVGNGPTFNCYDSGQTMSVGSSISTGTWYHGAITVAGTGSGQFLGYLNGVLNLTKTGSTAVTAVGIRFGRTNDGGDQFLGRLASAKIYSGVLTQAEIATEMASETPVRTSGLNSYFPFASAATAATDSSGNGFNLTVTGSLTTENGPFATTLTLPWQTINRVSTGPSSIVVASGFTPPSRLG